MGLARGEKVTRGRGGRTEEGRLAGAGLAHEGRHLARCDVARDVVEELALAALDRDRVVDVAPREDVGRRLERVGGGVLLLLVDGRVELGAGVGVALLGVASRAGALDGVDELLRRVATAEEHDAAADRLVALDLVRDEVDRQEEEEVGEDLRENRGRRGSGSCSRRRTR